MNGKTLTRDTAYLSFLDDLAQLGEVVIRVREKLLLLAPAKEGSYLRLVQETTRAIEESKTGKGLVFASAQEAIEDLHRLQKSYARKKTTAI